MKGLRALGTLTPSGEPDDELPPQRARNPRKILKGPHPDTGKKDEWFVPSVPQKKKVPKKITIKAPLVPRV